MMVLLIVVCYLLSVWLNITALRQIRMDRLEFIDGVVIGLTYYITIPMAIILLYGRVGPDFIPIDDYYPYEDTVTTFVILIGSMTINLLKIIYTYFRKPITGKRQDKAFLESSLRYQYWLTFVIVVLYITTNYIFFKASGVSSGGHWAKAADQLMSGNSLFLVIKYIGNFTRTAAFGALATLAIRQPQYTLRILAIAAVICLADMLMTFNRISVLYFMFLLLVVSRKHARVASIGLLLFLMTVSHTSVVWTEFRARLGVTGYTINGVSDAVSHSIEAKSDRQPLVDEMNGMFESIDITALNWIVYHSERIGTPFGSYFARPMTIIVPRSIWPDRPEPFALTFGKQLIPDVPLNSTLFGEPYSNSWLLWPFLIVLTVMAYQAVFAWMSRTNMIWGPIGALIAASWLRFDASFPACCMIFSVGLFFGFTLVLPGRVSSWRRSAGTTAAARKALGII